MADVIRGGCRLSYSVQGARSAPPLLLSNSLGTTRELWSPQVDELSRRFRVIRYDTRGHGASDGPRGAYTIEMLGLDALAVLDAAGVTQAHVCGLSLGGLTAMWLGVHAPTRVKSLVLASTAARIGEARLWQERIDHVTASGIAPLAEAAMGRWFTALFRSTHPDVAPRFHRMLVSSPVAGYAGCCAAIRDADLRSEIGAITVPTLVIAGIHDPVTPPADAEQIRARITGARIALLETAHLVNVELADAFTDLIVTFIDEQEPRHG